MPASTYPQQGGVMMPNPQQTYTLPASVTPDRTLGGTNFITQNTYTAGVIALLDAARASDLNALRIEHEKLKAYVVDLAQMLSAIVTDMAAMQQVIKQNS